MEVNHVRTGKPVHHAPHHAVPRAGADHDRRGVAGDIIGLLDRGSSASATRSPRARRSSSRAFPASRPSTSSASRCTDPLKRKQLKKGLDQLSEEGAVQLFFDRHRLERDPILGAVGVLQFEVIQHRLKSEYKVAVHLRAMPFKYARWVEGEPFSPQMFENGAGTTCVTDTKGRAIVLFENDWALRTTIGNHPELRFLAAVQPASRSFLRGGPGSAHHSHRVTSGASPVA